MKKTSFISALSIGILSISMAVAAPADAVNQIRQNATQVLSILKSGDANTARHKAEAYAIPYFDFQRMTALAVGNPWRTASDAQKQAGKAPTKPKKLSFDKLLESISHAELMSFIKSYSQTNKIFKADFEFCLRDVIFFR